MKKEFTSGQKEIIARKLGYDGPMQGFDEFVRSSPALSARYNMVTDKYVERMAKGGLTRKEFAEGGVAKGGETPWYGQTPSWLNPPAPGAGVTMALVTHTNPVTGETWTAPNGGYTLKSPAGDVTQRSTTTPATTDQSSPRPGGTTFTDIGGVPMSGGAAQLTAEQMSVDNNQLISTTNAAAPTTAVQAAATQAGQATTAVAPTPITTATTTASTSTPALQAAMQGVGPAQGAVSDKAQITAAQQTPTSTQVGQVQAAQLTAAQKVQAPVDRTAQAGEMITGTGVNMTEAEKAVQKTATSAAQGTVTDEMTTQGQLNKVLANFDAGNPPAWAAASMRTATATLAARGLSSSSMAGQAIIQAAMEAAVPIANADAQVFQQMGMQNLSNRQQTAVLAAQQRAAFLGQEFDQSFQMKVTNAAKVSDIANMNFTANQQIALENARMAQTVDLNNLSNRQAVVMAEAAQIASLETQNLSNRQQAQVANAQSFLQMDMANLDNTQQTTLFKAQQITNSLLSDTAAENASKQFNASSQNQTDQFMANLTTQTSQFNAAQKNAVEQFNTDQANSINKLNAEAQNARAEFNSSQRLVIDQANAQWRRDVSTANTAAINSANYLNAQNLQAMTVAEYNNETQLYRDQIQNSFDAYENEANRITNLAIATIDANAAQGAARDKAESDMWTTIGTWVAMSIR